MIVDTRIDPTVDPTLDDGCGDGHIVCCNLPTSAVEQPTLALCGTPSVWDGSVTDEIGCVVCADLDRAGYCPLQPRHRCPFAEPINES